MSNESTNTKEGYASFERMLEVDEKLAIFNDTVPAGILVVRYDDGRVVFSNRYFNDKLGISGEELLGASWEAFFVDHEERQKLMIEFSARDEVKDFEVRLRNRNGDEICGLASLSIIDIDEEDLLLFAFSDITELKRVQSELVRLNAELTDLNDLKNKFLGMAAHDLRNPLGAIQGMAYMIMELELEPQKEREFVASISDVSQQMLDLLNGLLDISAIESGKFELVRDECDVRELLAERIELLGFSARAKGIEISLQFEEIPSVRLDKARMGQVFDNLLSNALKFSKPGSKIDTIVHADGGAVKVAVRDYGEGIPPNEIGKIFQAFEKLSTKPTAGEKSTGLGLAIVKKIVDAHGGQISVASEIGGGAEFSVSLPLAASV